MLTLFRTKYRLRVIYKGGADHTFWVYSFRSSRNVFEWESVHASNKPLIIGMDHVAALFQTGYRINLFTWIGGLF